MFSVKNKIWTYITNKYRSFEWNSLCSVISVYWCVLSGFNHWSDTEIRGEPNRVIYRRFPASSQAERGGSNLHRQVTKRFLLSIPLLH